MDRKKSRKAIPIQVKQEIIRKYEEGIRTNALCKEYGMSSSTISTIIAHKNKFKGVKAREKCIRVFRNRSLIVEMEKLLLGWITEKQMSGEAIPVELICEQANAIHEHLKEERPGVSDALVEDFQASRGWFDKFVRRTGLWNGDVVAASEELLAAAAEGRGGSLVPPQQQQQQVFVLDERFWKSVPQREDRKYDFGSLSSSSGGGAPFAPGLNENSTESGEGAAGGGGGGGGGGGACEEGPVPMSPEQFLCEDMEHAGGASPHTPSSSSHQRPESYKLRHNNHLTLVLESLAGDESFMDVTLTAQGKAIKAHKSVLSAVSPYFRSVLKENPCQHPIIIMPRDIRFEELNNIISYVYKGEMTVAAEDLSSMLKTAEVLQVTGLSPSEAGSGAGGIMSHMQGLPAGVFGAGAAPPAKAKKAKHVHTQQHQVVAHEEEPHAANNHDIRGRIDPLDFLNADMTCVKEEIPSDTEETEDMGFTLPDDSSGPASKVTEPLPAAASFSSDPSTTRHPSNRRKSLDSPRPMDDPSNKPFNPGEPGPSPTEPQAAAAATPSPSSTPPPPHVCPHCLETHRPTDALHSHLRLKHPSKPSFVCASCGKVFLRHSLFAEHSKKCKV